MTIIIDLLSFKKTVFFLNVLNSKNLYLIILYGLIIDYLVSFTYGLITVFLIISFFMQKVIKNYYFNNLVTFIIFSIIFLRTVNLVSFFYQIVFIILNQKHIIKW